MSAAPAEVLADWRLGAARPARLPLGGHPAAAIVVATVAAAPAIWLFGLSAIAYHLAAVAALVALLFVARDRLWRIGLMELLLLSYVLIYALSISVNWNTSDRDRILASTYNLSLWLVGLVAVCAGRNTRGIQVVVSLARAVTWVLGFAAAGAGLALILWMSGTESLSLATPVGMVFREINSGVDNNDLLSSSLRLNLLVQDWFFLTAIPRTSVLAPYPVALAGLVLCCLPLVVAQVVIDRGAKLKAAVLGLLGLATLSLTLSRIALVALVFALILVWGTRNTGRFVLLLGSTLVVAILSMLIVPYLEMLIWLREGSTSYRMEMYEHAVAQTANDSLLLGLGLKPRVSMFTIPIGSHSTYLGAFVKTGVIGAFLIALIALRVGFVALRAAMTRQDPLDLALATSVLAMLIWMATEDIDAPQLVAFLFWFQVGLLERPQSRDLRRRYAGAARRQP